MENCFKSKCMLWPKKVFFPWIKPTCINNTKKKQLKFSDWPKLEGHNVTVLSHALGLLVNSYVLEKLVSSLKSIYVTNT